MRNRRPSPDHAEAVARRLALLEAELDATRRAGGTLVGGRAAHPVTEAVVDAVASPQGEQDARGSGVWPTGPATGPATRVGLGPSHGGGTSFGPEDAEPEVVAWVDLGGPVDAVGRAGDVTDGGGPPPDARSVKVPGRHARRRPAGRLLAGLPDLLADRVRFTTAHVTVVATVVAAALGVTCWWLVVGRVEPVLSPVASPVRTVSPGPASPTVGGSVPASPRAAGEPSLATRAAGVGGAAAELVVDVAGKVRRPGIVVLPAGSRVVDAIEAAGGVRRGVDLSPLNLARPLTDGEQILVGVDPPAGGAVSSGGATGGGAGGTSLVNINLATLEELDTLPGVGPVTAQAIVDWRTRHGGFTAVDDLLEVDGIGDATLQKLAPLVTL